MRSPWPQHSKRTYVISVSPESGTGEYFLKLNQGASVSADFDGDGDYDTDDIDALTSAIVAGGSVATFDLSGDGLLSMDDVDLWLQIAGDENLGPGRAYLHGDANLDGVVDGIDFLAWNEHRFTADSYWSHGDFNVDGVVDGPDFVVWNANKFQSAELRAGLTANPNADDYLFASQDEDEERGSQARNASSTSTIDAVFAHSDWAKTPW